FILYVCSVFFFFFFQAEDGIRDDLVTGVQTCALPIYWGPPFHGDDSAYFVSLQRNKKSVEIDLKHPQGKDLLLRLLGRCDVLLRSEERRVGKGVDLGGRR